MKKDSLIGHRFLRTFTDSKVYDQLIARTQELKKDVKLTKDAIVQQIEDGTTK